MHFNELMTKSRRIQHSWRAFSALMCSLARARLFAFKNWESQYNVTTARIRSNRLWESNKKKLFVQNHSQRKWIYILNKWNINIIKGDCVSHEQLDENELTAFTKIAVRAKTIEMNRDSNDFSYILFCQNEWMFCNKNWFSFQRKKNCVSKLPRFWKKRKQFCGTKHGKILLCLSKTIHAKYLNRKRALASIVRRHRESK